MRTDAANRRWKRAGFGSGLVTLVVLVATASGTPLYDGIGFPDEPYRYVDPPHGYVQKYKPTEARTVIRISRETNPDEGLISSGESGPQVAMYIPRRGLSVLDSASTVTVTARPVKANDPPGDGTLNSNVYQVDFSHPVQISGASASPPNITLREATFETVLAVMEYRTDSTSRWRRLETPQVGRDIYVAALQGAGQYVLVQPAMGTAQSARNRGTGKQLVFILGFCLLIVIVVVFAVRRTSGGLSDPDGG
jgi:hypothetical protein